MKKIFLLCSLTLSSVAIFAQKTYYPQGFFDKKQAQDMLAFGKSTIEGVASTRQKGFTLTVNDKVNKKQFAPEGTLVTLYPLTAYFEEFIKLRKQKENKKTSVYISDEAYKFRLEAKTDAYGRFKFEKLKPRKYFLESIIPYVGTSYYSQQTGTTTTYNGYGAAIATSPYYENFRSNYDASNRETKIVEIKSDGELIEIKL